MKIDEFRKKFPQYDDLNDQDLAKSLHQKYYSDVDYNKFAKDFGVPVEVIERRFLPDIEIAYRGPRPEDPTPWKEVIGGALKSIPKRFGMQTGGVLQFAGENLQAVQDKFSDIALRNFKLRYPDLPGFEPVAELGKETHRYWQGRLKQVSPELEPESFKSYANAAVQSVGNMGPALVAGALTGNPVVTLSIIGSQVTGETFAERREMGRPLEEANLTALGYAAAEAIPEMIPVGILLKPGMPFVKRVLGATAADIFQEELTEVLQWGIDQGTIHKDMPWGEARQQLLGRMKDAAIISAMAGPTQAAAIHPIVKKYSDMQQAATQEAALQDITELTKLQVEEGVSLEEIKQQIAPVPQPVSGEMGPVSPKDILDTLPSEMAGNIKLANVDTTDAIKGTLTSTAKLFEGTIDEARRGQQTNEQTRRLAEELGITERQLLKRRLGQAFNAEEALAARQMLLQSATELTELANRAQGGTDMELAAFHAQMARHVAIQRQVSGMTAEAGRALQQFRMLAEAKGRLQDIQTILDTQGGRKRISKIAEELSLLDTPRQINKYAREAYEAKTSDVLLEIWINALLSGPQTHVVNMTSNTLVAWLTMPEHVLAAGIGKLHGGEKVTFREAAARSYGFIEGAHEGVRNAWRTLLTEEPGDITTKIEARRHKAISAEALGLTGKVGKAVDITGQAVRVPGRMLMVEDEFFKGIGYRMELNALAYRQAISEGLKGDKLARRVQEIKEDPPSAMRDKAWDAAQYQTFTRPLGPTGRAIMRFAASHPAFKIPLPFIRTPTNIVKFATERSPLAPLLGEVREAIKKGGIDRDIALARIGLGSSIGAMTVYLAAQGLITGGGPDDPKERGVLYQTGWQPYSLKLGDQYYSYARLEPLGMLLGVSADAQYIWDHMDQNEADELAALIGMSISKNLTSKTWLRGVSDVIQAISDPDRYGERYVQRLAGTIVPTGIAQYTRVDDPYLRRVESITDQIRSRLPGKRETLLPRLNLWGEPIRLEGGLGPDILSPIYTSTVGKDPIAEEMMRLEIYPSMPSKRIGDIELTPELHNEYIRIAGQGAKRELTMWMQAPGWQNLPDFNKEDIIKDSIEAWRRHARKQILLTHQELEIERIMKLRETLEQAYGRQ